MITSDGRESVIPHPDGPQLMRAGRWGFLVDEGYEVLLLRLDEPLVQDLVLSLRWVPQWSDGGQGWLIRRCLLSQVRAQAACLRIALHTVYRLKDIA